MPVFNVRVIVW